MSCTNTDWIVYGLVHPDTKLINYIGLSTRGLTRPKRHNHKYARDSKTPLGCWLNKLHDVNINFEIIVLQILEEKIFDTLQKEEIWWIAYGKSCGWPLKNFTAGGEGHLGVKRTKAQKAKASADNRKRIWTPEMRRNLSEAMKKVRKNSNGQKPTLNINRPITSKIV